MTAKDALAARFRVDTRQLDMLYAYSRLPQWLMLLCASAIVLVMWSHAPAALLLGWLAVICALALLRSNASSCVGICCSIWATWLRA